MSRGRRASSSHNILLCFFSQTNNQEHRSLHAPVVGGVDFVPKQNWRAANSLFDDPAALRHTGNQLQHIVPLAVGCWVRWITLHKPEAVISVNLGFLSLNLSGESTDNDWENNIHSAVDVVRQT